MRFARYLLVGLLAVGGLTACDHSSRHGTPQPYTTQQVEHAFATAGIALEPGPTVDRTRVPSLRATFEKSDGSIQVVVYKMAVSKVARPIGFVEITVNGEPPQETKTYRNVAMIYPRHSRSKIRRAIRLLNRQ